MYRTEETTQLVTKGIPNRFRRDIWMTFSGAIFDKQSNPGIRFCLLMLFIPMFRIRDIFNTDPDSWIRTLDKGSGSCSSGQ